jgi:hypothetical protein
MMVGNVFALAREAIRVPALIDRLAAVLRVESGDLFERERKPPKRGR